MTNLPAPEIATLFFEPLDVLHFRDHRPFDGGLHTHARNVFPMPSVFLGCLRTALLTRAGARFDRTDFGFSETAWQRSLLGTKEAPGDLSLRGPLLARLCPQTPSSPASVKGFLPLPLDLRPPKNSTNLKIQRALRTNMRRYHGPQAEQVRGPVPWTAESSTESPSPDRKPSEQHDEDKKDLLSLPGVRAYLEGVVPSPEHRLASEGLYRREPRVGIVRSDERLTADDHLLYATEPFRFDEGTGLAVEVDLPNTPEGRAALDALHHAIVPLGGKGHRARIHYLPGGLLPPAQAERPASYKLWLVTPLVLAPELTRWPDEITCAAGERTEPVGGFDLAKRAPKPLRQALPAGTVLRVHGLSPEEALQRLAGAGEQWTHDRRAGFGVALVAEEADNL
ncbi:MAG: type III-B CRISPR module-associated Cmr3 family protein [Kofleriaceae bacterium]